MAVSRKEQDRQRKSRGRGQEERLSQKLLGVGVAEPSEPGAVVWLG